MTTARNIRKIIFAACFILSMQMVAYASFTASSLLDERSNVNKFFLKYQGSSRYVRRSVPFSLLKYDLQYRGSMILNEKTTQEGKEFSSIMQYRRGNTSYVFPYKFKVHVPKFKTPSAPNR